MTETIFFENKDVKVTNTRFFSGAQAYDLGYVTSLKTTEQKPNRASGIVVLAMSLVFASQSPYAGLILAVATLIYLYLQKTMYQVLFVSAEGEKVVFTTDKKDYLIKVVDALNQAILNRS